MHIVFAVADVNRARTFYERAFGWTVHLAWPDTYAEFSLPDNDWLGVYRRDGFSESAGAEPVAAGDGTFTGTVLYVQVEDLDRAIERLREAGAKPLSPRAPREWGHEAAYFGDPDGNIVAVARPLEPREPSAATAV